METYCTSKDYGRLYELVKAGAKILCFAESRDNGRQPAMVNYLPEYDIIGIGSLMVSYSRYPKTRVEFIENCEKVKLEFIDPASQPENRNVVLSYAELLEKVPGGADILWEENSVMSRAFEANGEAMHEEWGENECPLDALFRLYERARKAAGDGDFIAKIVTVRKGKGKNDEQR